MGMTSPKRPPFELPSEDTKTQNLRPVWRAGSVLEPSKSLCASWFLCTPPSSLG